MAQELREDLLDVERVLATAQRPVITTHLQILKASLAEKLAAVEAADAAKVMDTANAAATAEVPEAPEAATEAEPALQGSGMRDVATPAAAAVAPLDAGSAEPRRWEQLDYGWDAGEYKSPWVSIYITLEGVGAHKEGVSCDFSARGFDLKVRNVAGRSHRLVKTNLANDVVVESSKVVVKKDRLIVKLRKKATDYGGYEHWSELVAKRSKAAAAEKDPGAGIMDLMRDMYNDGDDQMKKVIGEAMMKSRNSSGGAQDGMDA